MKKIKEIPEVDTVYAKIGTADIATDPMPPSVSDNFIMLKPRSEWANPRKSRSELVHTIEETISKVPGNNYELTQPIQMRFNELIAGVRSDVAVKVFGDDMDTLLAVGKDVSRVLEKVSGASDVKVEQVTGLPVMTVKMNRGEMARYGLNVSDVQEVIEVAFGGKSAGKVFEGDRRFDLIVRLPEHKRNDMEALKRIPILIPRNTGLSGLEPRPAYIPLGAIAEVAIEQGTEPDKQGERQTAGCGNGKCKGPGHRVFCG